MSILFFNYIFYYVIATVGATYGLHRYWAHGQSKRRVWFEWLSLTCALFLGMYSPVGWVGIHRLHHRYSDTPNDPHCVKYKGFFPVLFSWWDADIPLSAVRDVLRNPRVMFFEKYGKYLIWPVIIISPYTVLFGILGLGVLNVFGHNNKGPINNFIINLIAPFEGNHADHHRSTKRR